MELLLASTNPNKRSELEALLRPLGVRVTGPDEVGGIPDVVEDGDTFAANAEKKARETALERGCWTLADDSGLEVDHLDGAPGVHSARFAGVHGDYAENNRLLLERLEGVPDESRGAGFVCVLALANPEGRVIATIEGRCRGTILHEERGTQGFGYDPLFLFTEEGHRQSGRCFAELTREEKSGISHRGRALSSLAARLPSIAQAMAE